MSPITPRTPRRNWERSRREVLRQLGLGAAALPLLWQSRASAAGPLKRLLCVVHTGGYRQASWRPAVGTLLGKPLPSISTPLEPHLRDVVFLPRLENPEHKGTGPGAYGTLFHGLPARSAGAFPEPLGPTLDQVVATGLDRAPAARRSLNLQVQIDRPPMADATAPGSHRCFFTGAGQPINPLGDPGQLYLELFAGLPDLPPAQLKRLLLEKRSILDYVGAGLDRWRTQVGTGDRAEVEAHQQSIRGLETRLGDIELGAAAPSRACAGPAPATLDVTAAANYGALLSAQLDIVVAAFRCGVTQVATLQLSDAVGANVDFAFVAVGSPPGGGTRGTSWRDLSRNPVVGGMDRKVILDRWLMERFAGLITRLKAVPEPVGTLLDSSVVMWGSNMEDGVASTGRVPFMLAGSGGGFLATGQCLDSGNTLASLHATVAAAMGVTTGPYAATPAIKALAR